MTNGYRTYQQKVWDLIEERGTATLLDCVNALGIPAHSLSGRIVEMCRPMNPSVKPSIEKTGKKIGKCSIYRVIPGRRP